MWQETVILQSIQVTDNNMQDETRNTKTSHSCFNDYCRCFQIKKKYSIETLEHE